VVLPEHFVLSEKDGFPPPPDVVIVVKSGFRGSMMGHGVLARYLAAGLQPGLSDSASMFCKSVTFIFGVLRKWRDRHCDAEMSARPIRRWFQTGRTASSPGLIPGPALGGGGVGSSRETS